MPPNAHALVSLALPLALLGVCGCTTADLASAPPRTEEDCTVSAVAYCDAGAPSGPAAEGCTATADHPSAVVRSLPRTGSYPVGCVASVLDKGKVDSCGVSATCRCVGPDGGSDAGAAWACDPTRR